MTAAAATDHARIYADLKAQVGAAGILDRSRGYYWPVIVLAFAGYGLSAFGIYALHSAWQLLPLCVAFSFFGVQLAGLMHDAGHRAVFSSRRANVVLGYVASAAIGMIFESWRSHHNEHHAHPNQDGRDPDMHVPFIAVSPELYGAKSAVERFFARRQVFYYHALGLIVSISNRLGACTYFFKRGSGRSVWKLALYLPAIALLFPLPFLLFPLDKALLVFAAVHASSGLYLASCFAPNHKGMVQVPRDASLSFLEQQVSTSRNVRGGFLTNLVLMGLNYQTEHHLFPTCPRNKLPLLTPYVREACAAAGLTYTEAGFVETNRLLLERMQHATRQPYAGSLSVG